MAPRSEVAGPLSAGSAASDRILRHPAPWVEMGVGRCGLPLPGGFSWSQGRLCDRLRWRCGLVALGARDVESGR